MKHHLRHFGALLVLILIAMIAACGAAPAPEQTVSSSSQDLTGLYGCTTDAQCRSVSWTQVGYCADIAHATCAPDHYCSYPVDQTNTACHCIVGDERTCAGGGFQTCFQGYSGGDWPLGGCDHSYDDFSGLPPTTKCSAGIDCDNWVNRPECASWENYQSFCATTGPNGRECVWQRDPTEAGCNCVERQVRDCTISPGHPGKETCVKTSANHTSWNACSLH